MYFLPLPLHYFGILFNVPSPQEAQRLILLETNHLEELSMVLESLKNALAENYEDIYLDNFSGKAIVSVLLKIAIDQAQVLRENVRSIPYDLSQVSHTFMCTISDF